MISIWPFRKRIADLQEGLLRSYVHTLAARDAPPQNTSEVRSLWPAFRAQAFEDLKDRRILTLELWEMEEIDILVATSKLWKLKKEVRL